MSLKEYFNASLSTKSKLNKLQILRFLDIMCNKITKKLIFPSKTSSSFILSKNIILHHKPRWDKIQTQGLKLQFKSKIKINIKM